MMALALAMALVLIALAAGLPKITTELRRQREQEMIHRGTQYTRAIKRYYRRVGGYPTSLDQLLDTNHLRFLRKRYQDPMTSGDFRPIHVGEVVLVARITPTSAPDASAPAGSPQRGGLVTPSDAQNGTGASDGPTFGGGPIMGVTSHSEKEGFRVYNDDDHYNQWLFVYSPLLDRGGLFSRPYDGIPTYGKETLPAPPPPVSPPGVVTSAPGVPIPASLLNSN
jgi:type II secretory pathway pseudopilin PulG